MYFYHLALAHMSPEERLSGDSEFKPNLVNSVCYVVQAVVQVGFGEKGRERRVDCVCVWVGRGEDEGIVCPAATPGARVTCDPPVCSSMAEGARPTAALPQPTLPRQRSTPASDHCRLHQTSTTNSHPPSPNQSQIVPQLPNNPQPPNL